MTKRETYGRIEEIGLDITDIYTIKYHNGRVTVAILEDETLAVFIRKLEDRRMRRILEYEFRISRITGIMLCEALANVLETIIPDMKPSATIITSLNIKQKEGISDARK